MFLSLQMNQKRHKKAAFQVFFLFLPTKEPPQLKSVRLTEECIIHCMSKRAKINCHNMQAFKQWRRIRYPISSFALLKQHLLGILQPLFLSRSWVKNFAQDAFQAKKTSSCRSPGVPNYTIRERLRSPTCRGVKRLDWKVIILCLQPHHTIIITQRDGIIMQPPKKDISFLQLLDI